MIKGRVNIKNKKDYGFIVIQECMFYYKIHSLAVFLYTKPYYIDHMTRLQRLACHLILNHTYHADRN